MGGAGALEARMEIADLIYGYAQRVREGRGRQCEALFTDDAIFEVRHAETFGATSYMTRRRIEGRQAIAEDIAKSAGAVAVCPVISNLLIVFEGPVARSTCVMHTIGGLGVVGEYRDAFRFEDCWRFSERIFTIVGELPPTTLA